MDGTVHDAAYDAERDRVFRQCGVRVLRFSNDDVELRMGCVLTHIARALSEFAPPA